MEFNLSIALIDAIDNVTWYNGLSEYILKWKNLPIIDGIIYAPYKDTNDDRMEDIWMILVSMFGDYGTSPRSGWIEKENKEAFDILIDLICKTELHDSAEFDYFDEKKWINESIEKINNLMSR